MLFFTPSIAPAMLLVASSRNRMSTLGIVFARGVPAPGVSVIAAAVLGSLHGMSGVRLVGATSSGDNSAALKETAVPASIGWARAAGFDVARHWTKNNPPTITISPARLNPKMRSVRLVCRFLFNVSHLD